MRRSSDGVMMALGVCVVLAGCSPVNREQLSKDVLKDDPEFSSVLEKYRHLAGRIETEERKLALKKTTVEQSIAQLRRDLAVTAANVKIRTAEIKKGMEPEQTTLSSALARAAEELRAKQLQRATLGRQIAQLRKAAKAAENVWTDRDRAKNDAQINELLRDAARVDQEIATMKAHIRLIKEKLLLIRF
ncbi:MAG: hypothetical protein HY352_03405 [Candidatus Omnitrophica bacterium]|nr:hypothetical protein [Candidatus Omnitrophota bacterium]